MTTKEIVSMIPLIEGTFSPKEATEIIETMVDDRVRFHSLQMLRMWEGNHKFDSSYWSKKIREMKEEKTVAKDLISEARQEGYKIEIVSTIKVRISKPAVREDSKLQVTNNIEVSNN